MPEIKTTRFGMVQVEEQEIIWFAEGIPGFPQEKSFILLPIEEDSPFVFMQSAVEPDLAFLLTDPFLFFKDYEFVIDDDSLEELGITDDGVAYYTIITMQGRKVNKMTANLVAPIIVNIKNRKAKQLVLEKSNYNTKHALFEAATQGGE